MASEGAVVASCSNDLAVHASALAIDGQALLIFGPSRSGKSHLAAALIARADDQQSCTLIGDDRILLSRKGSQLIARPHPLIAGFIERRGLGLVATPFVAQAPVAALILLGHSTAIPPSLDNFPRLRCVTHLSAEAVLRWWRGAMITPVDKTGLPEQAETQVYNW
jgi:HPr kinase/phosphorylase